jgi:hypothetical protein
MWNVPDSLFSVNENFFSQNLEGENKIFVLGSSHVYAVNPIIISEELEKSGYEFTVYNFGGPGEDFEERERTIDMLIKQKPQIVVYGIEPRGFETQGRTSAQLPDNPLPSIDSITSLFEILNFEKKGVLKNPKFALIRSITKPIDNTITIEEHPYLNTPFFAFDVKASKINDLKTLDKIKMEFIANINQIEKNSNLIHFTKIIEKFQENNIKIVLVVTPHSQLYIDNFPNNQQLIFQEILENISKTQNVKIYSVFNKYSLLNVWHDHTHLAVNNKTDFYSKDIAQFILEEIKS